MGTSVSSVVLSDKIVRTGWNYIASKHENNSKKSTRIPRTPLKQEQAVVKSSSCPRPNCRRPLFCPKSENLSRAARNQSTDSSKEQYKDSLMESFHLKHKNGCRSGVFVNLVHPASLLPDLRCGGPCHLCRGTSTQEEQGGHRVCCLAEAIASCGLYLLRAESKARRPTWPPVHPEDVVPRFLLCAPVPSNGHSDRPKVKVAPK